VMILLRVQSFYHPKKLVFGLNAINRIGQEANLIGGKKVLVVTDKFLEKMGVIDKVSGFLKDAGFDINVFNECEAEPRIEVHEKAKEVARSVKPDIVIGIGGGSNMDVAKTAAILANNVGDAIQYVGPPFGLFEKDRLPLILVPTTAGTGSEVTRFAVATVANEKRDMWFDPKLLCDTAIIDPMLTLTMPPKLTAATAIDALSHAIESILSRQANMIILLHALEAIKLISRYVRRAYLNGEDVEARYNLSMAATFAGIALCNAGAVLGHAVAFTFGAQHKIPHGVSVGIVLPYIMEYNLPLAQERLAEIAKAMGEETEKIPIRDAAKKAIIATKNLIESLEMPTCLKDVGIPKNEIDGMINRLLTKYKYVYETSNPCSVTEEKIRQMYEKIWGGFSD